MKYLLDTDICVELIRRKPSAVVSRLESARIYGIGISSIALAELELGVQRSQQRERARLALDQFLRPFTIVGFDVAAARAFGIVHAGNLALGAPIGPYDTLIAAQALSQGLILVTNNEREYRRVPYLPVENWLR